MAVNLGGRKPRLVATLVEGLPNRRRRTDSFVVESVNTGHVVAEVLVRPTRGIRVNLKEALPRNAPTELKRFVHRTHHRVAGAEKGPWPVYTYVDEDQLETARALLEFVAHTA